VIRRLLCHQGALELLSVVQPKPEMGSLGERTALLCVCPLCPSFFNMLNIRTDYLSHTLSYACQPLWSKKWAECGLPDAIESVCCYLSALQMSTARAVHPVGMNPVSILGIVCASSSITACIGGTIKALNDARANSE
jgi:hypothetical protein